MTQATILVTGASGQLGQELQQLASTTTLFKWIFTSRKELNIVNRHEVAAFFKLHKIDYCINCAAYTAVDKAETEREKAFETNATAVAFLAKQCSIDHVPLIHISSDYVYHNRQNRPLLEKDKTKPQGIYALSKLEGEQKAQAIHQQCMIIRTSWVYSSFGGNFVKTMLRLGKERDSLNIVFDQIGTPTYARDLGQAILDILTKIHTKQVSKQTLSGIYNYSNEGVTSWFDFAKAIFELKNISCSTAPIESKEYPTPAKRPTYSVMNKSKIKKTFGLTIPHWQDSLKDCLVMLEE